MRPAVAELLTDLPAATRSVALLALGDVDREVRDPWRPAALELGLMMAGFRVSIASTLEDAWQKTLGTRPQVMIAGGSLAPELCRRLRSLPEARHVPFLAIVEGPARMEALDAGADAVLPRLTSSKELAEHARLHLHRRLRERLAATEPASTGSLVGSLRDLGALDAVAALLTSGRTAKILLAAPDSQTAQVSLSRGRILHAEVGRLEGEAAFFRILAWSDGWFEVQFLAQPASEETPGKGVELLAEGLRRLRERQAVLAELPSPGTVLLTEFASVELRLAALPAAALDLLRLVDGRRTVHDLVLDSQTSDLETIAILAELLRQKLVYPSHVDPLGELAPEHQPRLPSPEPWGTDGVEVGRIKLIRRDNSGLVEQVRAGAGASERNDPPPESLVRQPRRSPGSPNRWPLLVGGAAMAIGLLAAWMARSPLAPLPVKVVAPVAVPAPAPAQSAAELTILANLALQAGRPEEALAHATRAIALDGHLAEAHFICGAVHGLAGRRVEAKHAYQRYLAIGGPQADEVRKLLKEL